MSRTTTVAFTLLLCAAGCSCTSSSEGLSPDLNLSLECSQPLQSLDEIRLEKALYSAGFDVLNRARLARELRVDFSPPVMIDAIDHRGRMVTVTGIGEALPGEQETQPFYLHFSLYSQPPTTRDAALEAQLEKLAAGVSMCSVAKAERHTNPVSSEWLYDESVERVRGWFKQARQEAPASDARRVHERR